MDSFIKLRIKKNTIYAFFFSILYKISLDLSYYFVISKVWLYMRYDLKFNVIKLFESYLLFFFIFFLMPKSKEKLSNVMIWLLILLSYVPMLTLYAFMDQSRAYMYAVTGFWFFVFLLLKFPTIHFTPFRKSQAKAILYFIFSGLSGVVFFLIYKYLGFNFNFDLSKVYDIRRQFVETKVPLAGYLFTWLAYVINPAFFALFLNNKKWVSIMLIFVLQFFLFSNTGNKTFLFSLPFVFALIWILKDKNPLVLISIGLTIVTFVGMLSYWTINDIWILGLFTNRTLLVPAQLSFFYYDFFSKKGPIFLSYHRIFKNFINYPYHLDPPHLIGEVYFNRPEISANNGIYADAYMNFGYIGFFLWGIFLTIILKLIDSFSKNKKITVTIGSIAMQSIVLTNSPLLTSLLTEGLVLSLVILYLLPGEKQ